MDNLLFSLNATVPIFLMMILGLFFNKIGWMDEEFANKMNKFVFRVPLPVLLFGAWNLSCTLTNFSVNSLATGSTIAGNNPVY